MNAVIEIDVGRARAIPPNELARARPAESVRGLVAFDHIGFALDHDPAAFSPNETCADQVFRANQRIGLKESNLKHSRKLAVCLSDKKPRHDSDRRATPVR